MATGNIAMKLGALLTLDDHEFDDKMEAKPAQAERSLSEVASIAERNLSQVSASAGNAQKAMEKGFTESKDNAAKSFKGMADSAKDSFSEISSLAMRFLSFGALAGTGAKVFGKFFIQEDAVEGLRASLHNLGRASTEAMGRYQQFASELQKKTRYGDETVLAAMTQGIRLGIDPRQIEEVTKASVGLAAKLGVDLHTAMMLVSRASQGNTAMLSRYGLKLDETKSKAEQFQDVLKFGKSGFSLAEDAAKTSAGAMEQMKNAIGDTMEEIGKALSEYLLPTVNVIKDVATWFNNLGDTTKRLVVGLGSAAAGMAALRLAGGGVFSMVTRLIPTLVGMGTAAAGAGAAAGGAATGFAAFWAAAAGPAAIALAGIVAIHAAVAKMNSYYDEAIDKAKDAQGQARQMREKMQEENSERTNAIKRLQEMSRIGYLNNATQKEANSLIEKYGLNMKVVNGQLVNMGDSFDILLRKQDELAKRQLAFSYQKEIRALESEMDAMAEKATSFWNGFGQGMLGIKGAAKQFWAWATGDKEYDWTEDDSNKSRDVKRYEELAKQREKLISDMKKAMSASSGDVSGDAEKQAQDMAKATRPALEALKKQREEYRLAAMDAKELKRELGIQRATLKDQISQHESLDDYTDEELEKLKEMEVIHNRILGIYEESAKYIQKQNDDLKTYIQERNKDLASRKFDKAFSVQLDLAKTREDDQRIADITARRVEVAKQRAKQALDWYNKELEVASDDDIITDKEKEQLDRRLQNLKDADALAEREQERHERAVETIQNHAAKRQEERNRRRAEALQRQASQISRRLGMLGMGNLDRDGFAFDRNGRFRGNVGAGALARFSRRRDSMAETRAKIEAMNAGQRTYIDAAGKERRVHFSLQDKRNMREVEKLEERRRRLEERAKDYTKPIEEVKGAVEKLGENCLIVKR